MLLFSSWSIASFFALLFFHCIIVYAQRLSNNYVKHVDLFIGTGPGGHVFPGPSLPWGMVKPGPDMDSPEPQAGYYLTGNVTGFSQLHTDGVIIQNFQSIKSFMPVTGENWSFRNYASARINGSDTASPGYFSIELERYNLRVELTTAARAALHRYTIIGTAAPMTVILDMGHDLMSSYQGGFVRVIDDHTLEGVGLYRGSFNHEALFKVYFHAEFDQRSTKFGGWRNETRIEGATEVRGDKFAPVGAYFTFPHNIKTVQARIGISFLSTEKARQNMNDQIMGIPRFNFESVRQRAEQEWNNALSRIRIEGASNDQMKLFYSSLYRTMLMPVNRTGENPNWQSPEPYYDDFYCIWDTFRCSHALYTLIQPDAQAEMMRSLIDMSRHYGGWLPDCHMGNKPGLIQGGSNGDILLADSIIKNLGRGISLEDAYRAMLRDADEESPDYELLGRGSVEFYKTLGYIPRDNEFAEVVKHHATASRTVEYAYNDFAIAMTAKHLGKTEDYKRFRKRGDNWQQLWDASLSDSGFTGFIQPRFQYCGPTMNHDSCYYAFPAEFFEASSWAYSFYAPQDVAKLIELMQGPETFVRRIDKFLSAGFYDVGNEPVFMIPYLYIWAGRHDLTVDRLREIVAKYFTTSKYGLPGNDDAGAMGAWVNWAMIGVYPVTGQDFYLLASPYFSTTTINLGGGHTFTIKAHDFSPNNRYVQRAVLNGKPLTGAWFRHKDMLPEGESIPMQRLMGGVGGLLELWMGKNPSDFGKANPPPSASTEKA
ncbi:uncharacterized protein VTP21DRAFT_5775 [Calcarisporiella thermophila]|uniref:uncharacterized protein n=1 Tax=Calcarisporiella thermophila TaxID=911321 RepID=UPI0037423DA9